MQNGTLLVSTSSNAITAALKTQAGVDPSPGSPVIVDFFDRAGGYHEVGITGPLSTTIPVGATCGAPSLQAFRGWWHLVDGPSPQIGFATYSGPSRILRPRDGGLITSAAPGNSPFTIYTPSAVSNASARIIGCSTWESGLNVAGQWSKNPDFTDLWQPGMPLPLDIIDAAQNPPFPNEIRINPTNAGQWYDTALAASITLKSAANFVQTQWCGNTYAISSGEQITTALFRNGAHIGFLPEVWTGGSVSCGATANFLDYPGTAGQINYTVRMKSSYGGAICFSYQEGQPNGADGQPILQLAEVMS